MVVEISGITWWKAAVEILILWYIFYRVMLFLEGTRAFYVIRGIVVLAIFFLVSSAVGLHTLTWLLGKVFAISILAFIVLFQPELRQGLARLGQNPLLGQLMIDRREIERLARDITIAVSYLAEKRIGALIAIERSIGLRGYADTGIRVDALVSPEIIETIFYPGTPLHDGGMVIKGNRIMAAGCLFPLTDSDRHSSVRGTRHRAGIGISEETDAICIIVSEELGTISWAVDGRLTLGVSPDELYRFIVDRMIGPQGSWIDWIRMIFRIGRKRKNEKK